MDEAAKLVALRQLLDNQATDIDTRHEIYHDDAILEFPQSQERFEGKQNFLAWRRQYPAVVDFKIRRIQGRDDLWIAEASVRYDGGSWGYGCSIHEFRGDKIARETIYYGEGWEAPEWRAPWRAAWVDETVV